MWGVSRVFKCTACCILVIEAFALPQTASCLVIWHREQNKMDEDQPLTKKDLKDFSQQLLMEFSMGMGNKPTKAELTKPSLNHQYEHNVSVLEKISKAKQLMEDNQDPKLVTFLMDGAINEIKERNKKLLVADSSAGGWAVVKEMERGRILEDEDEAKLVRQAEKTVAERRRREHPYRKPYQKPFQRAEGSQFGQRPPRRGPSPYDICRACGALGHWARDCTNQQLPLVYQPAYQTVQFPVHSTPAPQFGTTQFGAAQLNRKH